ncbi:branched-chain amino acid ABC transporter permease/ATP-binding protein [Desertimonas flava]|uniref:branched-chain amino acid ABC transporter permease/ATP-binding protein n=1 Tax=Desertimonas flava TaxID=2064846 RepID=UPI000E34AA9A|nr:branched-chain amino acid ABC transporter permease/ATP-binding protein [Desertimonas flava]
MNLTDLSQFFFSGLTIGCIYALVALGFVVIANVTQVYNFAQGEYVMIGAMIVAAGTGRGWSLGLLVPLAAVTVGAVALVQERVTVAPVRDKVSPLTIVVGTLGVSVVLRGLALLIWKEDPLRAPAFVNGTFGILGARLTHQSWIVWATTAASLVLVTVLFRSTASGRAMRACAINRTALRLLGVRPGPIATRAFVLSGVLAGLVGAVTVPITLVRWNSGLSIGLVAFIAAAIGRFNSPGRTVVAGLGLGIVESMASGLISSQYRSAYVYGVLVVYLLGEDALGHDGLLNRLRRRWAPAYRHSIDVGARPALSGTGGSTAASSVAAPARRSLAGAAVPVVLIAAAALVPVLVQSSRGRDTAVFAVLSAIAATGLVLVIGLANQISLGQAAFMLIGGYSAAILTATHGWNLVLAIAAAVVVTSAGALVVGALTLRLTGFNLAIATLGVHLILLVFVLQWNFTGKTLGVTGVPPFELFGVELRTSFRFYYVALVALAVCLWLARNLWHSQIGRNLRALGADEEGARSLGIRAFRLKLTVFVVSGAMGGLAGALWAMFVRFAAPSTWDVGLTIDLVTYTIVGGLLSVYGGAVGAAAVSALLYVVAESGIGGDRQQEVELILSGLLLVLFVLLFRDGLVVAVRRSVQRAGDLLTGGSGDAESPVGVAPVVAAAVEAVPAAGAQRSPGTIVPLDEPVVTVRGVSRRFGALMAVDDVDIELLPGTVTALVGPNGAGKSTMINVISGVLAPTRGDVSIAGRTAHGRTVDEIARLGLGRTFQTPKTFGGLTAVESVMLARDSLSPRGVVTASLALPAGRRTDEESRRSAMDCLAMVGLDHAAHVAVDALPAGHQRLVDVARALALEPHAVLLDEPAAGLDHTETAELGTIIRTVAAAGIAVLLVEHDMRLVMKVADRVVVLDQGRKLADGTPADVAADQRVLDAYLGAVPA